jgi:hypothetical protein
MLDGPSLELHILLAKTKLFARGDTDHLLDEIDAGDHLGHGVLDLQPRVHLEEEEGAILAGDKLDRTSGIVADRLGERDGLCPHRGARPGIEKGTWRFLDDFLIAPLNGAFAFAEMNDIAMLVAEHLDFDMARIDDEFLDEDAIVTE